MNFRIVNCRTRRSDHPSLSILSLLLLGILQAAATIDASLQMQLGNPSNASVDPNNHNHYLIQRTVEAMDYSDNYGEPVWVSWDLTTSDVGSVSRSNNYLPDTNLPSGFYEVTDNDYVGVGAINFNRGHMCPSEDRTDTRADNDMLFLMSNIIPQAAVNNQGVWGNFEGQCRTWAASGNEILIVCGPSGFGSYRLPSGKAVIANYTWKIAVVVPTGSGTAASRITAATRVVSLNIPNSNTVSSTWQDYITSAHQIELATGLTFFTALPPEVASVLRAKVDGQTIPAPAISGFSPSSGAVNTVVVITGTNFDSASSVTFHGTSASFTVNSTTQLTATVPAGATSGTISVVTAGGTATSASSFSVTTVLVPDLVLAITHTGNFIQGDTGDTYTLLVTNIGTAASTGTVTVTNSLPAGLTATTIGGAGWTPNLATLTCTRSDAVSAGVGYPPITLTVNVSSGAAASLTNRAAVSGGGDTNLANNTASDPTTVQNAGAPIVVTSTATAVATETATLNGTVNPNNQVEGSWFEYGLTTSYGATGTVSGTLTGTTAQPVSVNLSGLSPGTTYHYRLNATNVLGAASGLDQTFTASSGATVGSTTTLVGWDVSTMPGGANNYGPSPLSPSTNSTNLIVSGLTRGSGITVINTGAAHGWGGNGFTDGSAAAAVSANRLVSFTNTGNAGYKVSFTAISRFDYRRSGTGPTNGLVQYQVGSGAFSDIATVAYTSSATSGASLGPIDLTGISALQNVSAGTPVTFRIANWGATSSGGTWYIFDVSNSSATDLEIQGIVSPVVVAAPDLALRVTHTGTFTQADTGDTCTVTVTNLGSAATAGLVTVSNTLPAGLMATGLSGAGWTVNLGTLTCTRSDTLAAGAAYPPITVTVNVATNAPAALTNTFAVAGGGDTTLANNTANDIIAVTPLTPVQAWRLQWFGTTANSGLAADSAVRTSDGLPNLVKYALGLNPLVAANNPVIGDVTTGFLRLTSPKNPSATDISFSVEAAGYVQSGWATNGTAVDQNTPTLLQVHDATPVSSAPERFLRLRVSRP